MPSAPQTTLPLVSNAPTKSEPSGVTSDTRRGILSIYETVMDWYPVARIIACTGLWYYLYSNHLNSFVAGFDTTDVLVSFITPYFLAALILGYLPWLITLPSQLISYISSSVRGAMSSIEMEKKHGKGWHGEDDEDWVSKGMPGADEIMEI
jgi:hypothetical protein